MATSQEALDSREGASPGKRAVPLPSTKPRSYQLTTSLLAAHAGTSGIVCLDARAEGQTFRLHAERPGPALNLRAHRAEGGEVEWRADLPSGAAHVITAVADDPPALIRVDISGPLLERAGYQDPCSGYADGHDAVCERLCAAFALGDVLLVIDCPGGAAAGLQQNVERAAACKARYGRHVTVYANETIGSAAMWWAFGVGDELFGPAMCQIGSIGARGAHASIAGALAKEGVVFTYFTWPNAGKVALAPELPLSAEGQARGERDIRILGEAFAAAVVSSPMGQRFGLTPETIAALSADVFTGAYALTCPDPISGATRAQLIDGIETLETVTAHALLLAESGEARALSDTAEATAAGAQARLAALGQGERAMTLQASGEAAPGARAEADGGEMADEPVGLKPNGICKACNSANPVSHKFCSQCGESMEAAKIPEPEKDDDGDDDDNEPAPSSKPAAVAATVARTAALPPAPKAMDPSASLASILGATGESPLAVKTAAIAMRLDRDRLHAAAVGLTGKTSTDAIIGKMLAIPAQLASGKQAAADLANDRAAADKAARAALFKRGIASGHAEMSRGKVWVDGVDDKTGVKTKTLKRHFAEMSTESLREYVEELESTAPRKDPFKPDEAAAKTIAAENNPMQGDLDASGEPTAAAIARAVKDPAVLRIFNGQTGATKQPIEAVARIHIKAGVKAGLPVRAGGAA